MITDTTAYKKFFQSFKELYTPSAELSQIDINLTEANNYFQKFKASYSAAQQQGLFLIFGILPISEQKKFPTALFWHGCLIVTVHMDREISLPTLCFLY